MPKLHKNSYREWYMDNILSAVKGGLQSH